LVLLGFELTGKFSPLLKRLYHSDCGFPGQRGSTRLLFLVFFSAKHLQPQSRADRKQIDVGKAGDEFEFRAADPLKPILW
jgi:hypothetical protein